MQTSCPPSTGKAEIAPWTGSAEWQLDLAVRVADRPGELASISAAIAAVNANIERFWFDRGQDPCRVEIVARCPSAQIAGSLMDTFRAQGRLEEETNLKTCRTPTAAITDEQGLLRVRVRLEDRPGVLSGFAGLLKENHINVIYMHYDGREAPGQAEVALAASSAREISRLLRAFADNDYFVHVEWLGGRDSGLGNIPGLTVVELFLLRLKTLLPKEKLDSLTRIIESSDSLTNDLLEIGARTGKDPAGLAASEVFTRILHLAASSLTRTGPNFQLRLQGPLRVSDKVRLYLLCCPTGANAYLLRGRENSLLIDSSYGIYFDDAVSWMEEHNFAPELIRSALFTHADADHAGWAAFLEERYATRIFMHPDCCRVIAEENRAAGSATSLQGLNQSYTRLVNNFTDFRAPREILPFPPTAGTFAGLPVIGGFAFEDLLVEAVESKGGHVPGQVFFLCRKQGLFFSGDYLLDLPSMSDRTKSTLSLARFLMTSTNVDSRLFGEEMELLRGGLLALDDSLRSESGQVRILPGHGDIYSLRDADWQSR